MAERSTEDIYNVPQIARLPQHLKQYIVSQEYESYTPVDHAAWRYILRQARDYHRKHAHPAYLDGLKQTGIGLERIPRIEEMNEILGRIGWGAASVDGFIPPAAFMEFQAHRVLVIAADMRQIDHLEYTPAPDIIHEAAGHAPIIADPEYAEYLRRFGEYGAKALSSREDHELYEAIRHLSIIKEAPGTPAGEIEAAEKAVEEKQAALGEPSEMTLLSRLHWWTVEYGLVGEMDDPKLYGAGLLSSIGEAQHCLTDAVRKLPYNLETANYAYDITKMQPQLFVSPDFAHLVSVLEEFADGMSFRLGGQTGLARAIRSAHVATFVYTSGLQVSGIVAEVLAGEDGEPLYVRTEGPTALAVDDAQLEGHGKEYHRDGFGSPVGSIRGSEAPLEDASDSDLAALGLVPGERGSLAFESGVLVEGRLDRVQRENGKIVVLTFGDCRATLGDRVLFDPSWGSYDMAVGSRIVSVYHGAADKDAYEQVPFVPRERTIKVEVEASRRPLLELYAAVREVRERGTGHEKLAGFYREVCASHSGDWLLSLEILEELQAKGLEPELRDEIRAALEKRSEDEPTLRKLIRNGLTLAG